MFNNTLSVIDKIVDDLKRVVLSVQIAYHSIVIICLTYSIITMKFLWANIPLLLVTIIYSSVYFSLYGKKDKVAIETKKSNGKIYRYSKILFKGLTLIATIISFYSVANAPGILEVASTLIMAIGWVFSLLIELISIFVENRITLLKDAFAMDREEMRVENVINRLTGKESTPIHQEKNYSIIKQLANKRKERIAKEKEEKRLSKIAKRNNNKKEKFVINK